MGIRFEMHAIRSIVLLIALAALAAGCATTGTATETAVIRAKDKVAEALVHVRPVKEIFRQGERQEVSVIGSGFIISPDGYVVTNEHVAGQSSEVRCVLFDKDEVEAEVVGVDPDTDIAVLKLQTDRTDLPVVKLGSSSTLEAGQTVLALGSPHGLSRSVSLGIVSVTDRNLEDAGSERAPFNNWIQTDAAINPGNSGGPLVNLKGEVVGINTRKLQGADNVGFAIPIDIAREVINELIANGKVARSSIGTMLQEMTSYTDDPTQQGVLIGDVDPLSPAAQANVRPGDILLGVDGIVTNARFTEDLPAVRKMIADKPVGGTVTLTLLRNGETIDVPVVTEERSAREGEEVELKEWGCTISALTPPVMRSAQLRSRQGVYASGVQVGSLAFAGGLRQGDIILFVDNVPIKGLDDFDEIYKAKLASAQPRIMLTVKSGALSRFVMLKQQPGATPPAQNGQPAVEEVDGE
jgi:serine protease Do